MGVNRETESAFSVSRSGDKLLGRRVVPASNACQRLPTPANAFPVPFKKYDPIASDPPLPEISLRGRTHIPRCRLWKLKGMIIANCRMLQIFWQHRRKSSWLPELVYRRIAESPYVRSRPGGAEMELLIHYRTFDLRTDFMI